jgi:hypothetical protein
MSSLHTQYRAMLEARRVIAQPGTAVAATIGRLREELRKSADANTFDDRFADGVSQLMHDCKRRLWHRLLVAYALFFLLFILLGRYTMPLELPYLSQNYLSQNTTSGLLDITLVVLLLTSSTMINLTRRAELCEVVLRVYCEERYSTDQHELVLLRWGVDSQYYELGSGEYGKTRLKERWKKMLIALETLHGILVNALLIGMMVMILWGVGKVLYEASYGVISIFLVITAFGTFLSNFFVWMISSTKTPYVEQHQPADEHTGT